MPRRHVIISGTGRAGITFLAQLFTRLGIDTGFNDVTSSVYANCNAGTELDIRDPGAPYVIKSPWLCQHLEEVLDAGDVVIDRAIIPVRDLYSAAESRRDVARRADPSLRQNPAEIPGGLWQTSVESEQEIVLAELFYNLLHTLAKHDVPVTLLYFPRIIHDPEYLHAKTKFLLPDQDYGKFLAAFQETANPRLVHDFQAR